MSERTDGTTEGEMLAEYDFSGGQRGKHAEQHQTGHSVTIRKADGTTLIQQFTLEEGAIMLAPDVREYFADSDAVNQALRGLIDLIPHREQSN
jgi:hypothetical protein